MFSVKNFFKLLILVAIFFAFFKLIEYSRHLNLIQNAGKEDLIPVIEANPTPYRIEIYEDVDDSLESYENSCTLNNEC